MSRKPQPKPAVNDKSDAAAVREAAALLEQSLGELRALEKIHLQMVADCEKIDRDPGTFKFALNVVLRPLMKDVDDWLERHQPTEGTKS